MLLSLLLFVSCVFSLAIIFLIVKPSKNEAKIMNLPPGPKGLPLIGNIHQLDLPRLHIYLANLAKTYGPILSMRFVTAQVVVVQSAKLAKEVLKNQDQNFCRRPPMLGMQKISYQGLDIAFSQDPDLSSSRPKDLTDLVMSFGSSNICRTAFGKRYDSDNEGYKKSKFQSLLNEVQAMFTTFFFADFFPALSWLDKLCGQSARLEKVFKAMDAFFDEVIKDHLDPNRHKPDQEDLIDVLLRLRRQGATTFELTFDHIKAVLMDIFIAGTDTSTTMVVWAMTELVKNPNTMKKVQEELRNMAGNRGAIIPEDLPKLEYFKAMIKETFRFHPANPLLVVRETLEKTSIQGYEIPKKTLMFVNAWKIGRDPEYWKDPEKFMPERFLGSSIEYKGQDFELLPFGAGRKMCPGMHLGVANYELALANLLYVFDWELPVGLKREDIDTDTLPGVTMYKKIPLCLLPRPFIY